MNGNILTFSIYKKKLNTIDVALWRTISLQRRKTTGQPTQKQIQNNVSLWVHKFDVCFHVIVVLIFVASDIFHLRNISIFRILLLCKKKDMFNKKKKTSYNETTDISLRLSPEMHITCLIFICFIVLRGWENLSTYISDVVVLFDFLLCESNFLHLSMWIKRCQIILV